MPNNIPNIVQISRGRYSVFNGQQQFFKYKSFGGGYNTRDNDSDVKDDELTGGQNVDLNPDTTISKRKGHALHGNYLGNTTGILGLVDHSPQGGTSELLYVYDTKIYRDSSGIPLTGVTLTTNKKIDYAYHPFTSKTYVVNGTDNVVKYVSGASGDQTDSSFKKGKFIEYYQSRLLVANVSGYENCIFWTDIATDTFPGDCIKTDGEITGIKILYDRILTFTKHKIYMSQNIQLTSNSQGTAGFTQPDQFNPLKTDFGAIYDRSIAKVNNLIYFIGQNSKGIAGVYVTDGLNVTLISDIIRNDLNNVAPAQLLNACGTQWGRFYRFSITPTGQTSNTLEYLYDTTNHVWYPPYTSIGFSCYLTYETSGELDLYAGSQIDGRIYKLNTVDYDESIDQKLDILGDDASGIYSSSSARAGQSFKLNGVTSESKYLSKAVISLKKHSGTTTDLVVRVETDNNGKPSGTLVSSDATTTLTAFSDSSYVWKTVNFTPFLINCNTKYWLVVKHAVEGSGNSSYYWQTVDISSYTRGDLANYDGSNWIQQIGSGGYFAIFVEGSIEAFVDTKQFYLAQEGYQVQIRSMFVTAKALGDWNVECGIIPGSYYGNISNHMNTDSSGDKWGTGKWGEMLFGGSNLAEKRLDFQNLRGRGMKFRFRNQYANQPFTINGFTVRYHTISKFR